MAPVPANPAAAAAGVSQGDGVEVARYEGDGRGEGVPGAPALGAPGLLGVFGCHWHAGAAATGTGEPHLSSHPCRARGSSPSSLAGHSQPDSMSVSNFCMAGRSRGVIFQVFGSGGGLRPGQQRHAKTNTETVGCGSVGTPGWERECDGGPTIIGTWECCSAGHRARAEPLAPQAGACRRLEGTTKR